MIKTLGYAALTALLVLSGTGRAYAHCEIPCGIYGDEGRFVTLKEHVTTIEKSMKLINELSADGDKNYNQIVRWVGNKEAHADAIREIVAQYFLAQRVKVPKDGDAAAAAKYAKQLSLLHKMIVHSMKAKQTTDTEHTDALKALISEYEGVYFGKAHKQGKGSGHKH